MLLESLQEASEAVLKAQWAARHPRAEVLFRSQESLAGAESALRQALACAAACGPRARPAATRLAAGILRDLQRANRLLGEAAAFFDGWTLARNTLTAGYDAQGRPADPGPSVRELAEA